MKASLKIGGLALVAAAAVGATTASRSYSADHRDAPATTADPASDINDVYTFVDGNNFVAAMTVFPFATAGASFSDKTQYVFHTESQAAFGAPTPTKTDIICKFASNTSVQCWVGADEYVSGDPSAATGLTSKDGKVKVFAGMRGDPFFFNLQGFKDTVSAVEAAAGGLTFDTSGCPAVDTATSNALINTLKETTSTINTAKTQADDFAKANVLALVVSVDRSLVTKGGNIVSVWASTNKAQ